jgi:hypothetical protein
MSLRPSPALAFKLPLTDKQARAKQISVATRRRTSRTGKQKQCPCVGSVFEIKRNVVELKLERLMDEMRLLKWHTIAFDTRLLRWKRISNRANDSPKANPRRGSRPPLVRRQGQLCLQSRQRSVRPLTKLFWEP